MTSSNEVSDRQSFKVGDRVEWNADGYETAIGVYYARVVTVGNYAVVAFEEDYGFGWGERNEETPYGQWAIAFNELTLVNSITTIKEPDESIYNDLI